MAVTSQLRAFSWGDVEINAWRAGLLKPSAIKPLIATIEQGLVINRLVAYNSSVSKQYGRT